MWLVDLGVFCLMMVLWDGVLAEGALLHNVYDTLQRACERNPYLLLGATARPDLEVLLQLVACI